VHGKISSSSYFVILYYAYENIIFSCNTKAERTTLSNTDLDISVGSLVSIVGGTGEGKTSLVSEYWGRYLQ